MSYRRYPDRWLVDFVGRSHGLQELERSRWFGIWRNALGGIESEVSDCLFVGRFEGTETLVAKVRELLPAIEVVFWDAALDYLANLKLAAQCKVRTVAYNEEMAALTCVGLECVVAGAYTSYSTKPEIFGLPGAEVCNPGGLLNAVLRRLGVANQAPQDGEKSSGLRVAVGIPTLCCADLLVSALDILEPQLGSADAIFVIDNGGQKLASRLENRRTKVIENGENAGVAKSWNQLIRETLLAGEKFDWLVLMNDDVALGQTQWEDLKCSLADATEEGKWLVTGSHNWSVVALNAECIREVGLFDEQFFPAYFEDNDYHRRLYLIDPNRHLKDVPAFRPAVAGESVTLRRMPKFTRFDENRRYYINKWGGLPGEEKFAAPFNGTVAATAEGQATATIARGQKPEELHRANFEAKCKSLTDEPVLAVDGRGIVICGGGHKYFPGTWVCIRMLRKLGCQLPVEVWHLGEKEMSSTMRELLTPYNVRTIDAEALKSRFPVRHLAGWELKAYALLHSNFAEVLLLDADNVPLRDPAFLFEAPEYLQAGAVFWPDYGRLGKDRKIWGLLDIEYRNEPEFESGQILLDKRCCWKALKLAMHLNEWSEYYYEHIHGDKETFHMAWRKLGQEYAMPKRPIYPLPFTMCQHDFAGARIFQHRNMDKWSLWGTNKKVRRFEHEETCFALLEELRALWDEMPSGVSRYQSSRRSPEEIPAAESLLNHRWKYSRVGHDWRPMTFSADGLIGEGRAGCEIFWDITQADANIVLKVCGIEGQTFQAQLCHDGIWRGQWDRFEQMPIELAVIERCKTRISAQLAPNRNGAVCKSSNSFKIISGRAGHGTIGLDGELGYSVRYAKRLVVPNTLADGQTISAHADSEVAISLPEGGTVTGFMSGTADANPEAPTQFLVIGTL